MTFRVELTAEAERDLDAILEWLLDQQAGETGLRWFEELEEAIASLSKLPQRWPVAPESFAFPFEVRHLLYGHRPHIYRILFTISDKVVYVLHVRHGRRRVLKH